MYYKSTSGTVRSFNYGDPEADDLKSELLDHHETDEHAGYLIYTIVDALYYFLDRKPADTGHELRGVCTVEK